MGESCGCSDLPVVGEVVSTPAVIAGNVEARQILFKATKVVPAHSAVISPLPLPASNEDETLLVVNDTGRARREIIRARQ